jgi:hypothetical protein
MKNEKIIETNNAVGKASECERCAELEKELESLYSWQGLMKILDKVYPEWLFTSDGVKITEENYESVGDICAVVVNMIRAVDEAEKEIEKLKADKKISVTFTQPEIAATNTKNAILEREIAQMRKERKELKAELESEKRKSIGRRIRHGGR